METCKRCDEYILWSSECSCKAFEFKHPDLTDDDEYETIYAKDVEEACEKIMIRIFEDEGYHGQEEEIEIKDHGKYLCYGEYDVTYSSRKIEEPK